MPQDDPDLASYWAVSEQSLLRSLDSSFSGLSESECHWRLSRQTDVMIRGRRRSRLSILVSQFNNPIILLLFISAALSYLLDDATNSFIILLILLLSGLLGFWQEWSAADAVERLLAIIQTKTAVLRAGRELNVPHDTVVPGDIILLRAGTLVPGDSRILESRELCVDEAALTGESFPVEKSPGCLNFDTPLSKRTNCLFLGTHIVSGMGKALVVRVGRRTEFGQISAHLEDRAPSSGFEQGLRGFGKLLLGITGVLVVVVFLASVYFQRPIVESLLFALALAVGMTPQLLPAITSVVLAKGAKSMARADVIVKQLLAIENFGGMDILCLDKTGTLTEGTVELQAANDVQGQSSDHVLRLARINAHLETGFENPIDSAIRRFTSSLPDQVSRLDELPYDFSRKRLSVLVEDQGRRMIITKGALHNVLEVCTCAEMPDGTQLPLEKLRDQIIESFTGWSDRGYRVLGIAYRKLAKANLDKADETQLTFAGFLIFSDPPKAGISDTMQRLAGLGVQLKLVTGDNKAVAVSIGRQVGLRTLQVLSGQDIHQLSDEQLKRRALETDIFAEIEPEQKSRIVLALKSSKHTVGFLGDGINDAPALHTADVGISVVSAVDVAKEAADVVLLKPDLGVLAQGVYEGRKTLANTLKYVFVSISANFGYMLSIAITSLFLPFLPLLPTQILLINLLADFPAMALATDSVDPEIVDRPRSWDIQSILRFMLMFGLTGTCFDLLTFAGLLVLFQSEEAEFRTVWFMVSIFTGLIIMLAVRTRRPFFRSRPGFWLIVAATGVAIVTLTLPFLKIGKIFDLVRPSPVLLGWVALISIFYALAMEAGKRLFYGHLR
jgi:P-type Mg2+ transporter